MPVLQFSSRRDDHRLDMKSAAELKMKAITRASGDLEDSEGVSAANTAKANADVAAVEAQLEADLVKHDVGVHAEGVKHHTECEGLRAQLAELDTVQHVHDHARAHEHRDAVIGWRRRGSHCCHSSSCCRAPRVTSPAPARIRPVARV